MWLAAVASCVALAAPPVRVAETRPFSELDGAVAAWTYWSERPAVEIAIPPGPEPRLALQPGLKALSVATRVDPALHGSWRILTVVDWPSAGATGELGLSVLIPQGDRYVAYTLDIAELGPPPDVAELKAVDLGIQLGAEAGVDEVAIRDRRGRAASVVTVRLAAGSNDGDLDVAALDAAIDPVLEPLRACVLPHTLDAPDLVGIVEIALSIGRDGAVTRADVLSDGLANPAITACMRDELAGRSWPTGGLSALAQLSVSVGR